MSRKKLPEAGHVEKTTAFSFQYGRLPAMPHLGFVLFSKNPVPAFSG
jgi:hypothetical protein